MNMTSSVSEKTPVIVTVTGPSGSGKTVLSHLLAEEGLRPLVSTTTRHPRASEVDGRDYHFISKEDFAKQCADGLFIESIEYNNTNYGVSAAEAHLAFSQGRPAVLVAEPHGVQQIADYAHHRGWQVLRVFVDNPEEILIGRLFNRLLLDMGRTLPGPADRPHESFAPYLARAVEMSRIDQQPDIARAAFVSLLRDFLDDPTIPSPKVFIGPDVPTAAEFEKRLDAAAHRLANFGFEQANWVIPARSTESHLYDVVTDSFDQSVQAQVVSAVLKRIHELESVPYVDPSQDASESRPASRRSHP
jgi:guanylate kinase